MDKTVKRLSAVLVWCISVCLAGHAALGQEDLMRRIKAAQYADVAQVLNLGEIVMRVTVSGQADIIAAGKYCGAINLPTTKLDGESYKQHLFAQLDALLRRETGFRIEDFTDLFVFFDPDVSEETVAKHRVVFQRYEPCYYNCCTPEHAYRCCPSRISPWFLRIPPYPLPNLAEAVRCIQHVKLYEIARVNVLVVSDDTAQDFGMLGGEKRVGSASLAAWLQRHDVVTAVYELRLERRADGVFLTGTGPTPQEQDHALTIVILAYDRARYDSSANTLEYAIVEALAVRLSSPFFVLLLSFTDPTSPLISPSLTSSPELPAGRGVFLVSAEPQSSQVLEELLAEIKSQQASVSQLQAFAIIASLRVYGFVVYPSCIIPY